MKVGDEVDIIFDDGRVEECRVVGYDDAMVCVAYQDRTIVGEFAWELAWVKPWDVKPRTVRTKRGAQ